MAGFKIENMRQVVSDAYPGMVWKERVAHMSVSQVIAIYHSIQARKIHFRVGPNQWAKPDEESMEYHQYNLFEFGLEVKE
mgnify:CR=1 FL=1